MKAEQLTLFSLRSNPDEARRESAERIGDTQPLPSLARRAIDAIRKGSSKPESIEVLLRCLRGGSLILAVLSYDLGLRISQLVSLRVRDVNLAERSIRVGGRERVLPSIIIDDLREHINDRLCGREASHAAGRRDQPLFPAEEVAALRESCERWFVTVPAAEMDMVAIHRDEDARLPEAAADALLRHSGRWHKKIAMRQGIKISSPLELFDKGPRIVRRRSAGFVDAYYAWRITGPI